MAQPHAATPCVALGHWQVIVVAGKTKRALLLPNDHLLPPSFYLSSYGAFDDTDGADGLYQEFFTDEGGTIGGNSISFFHIGALV